MIVCTSEVVYSLDEGVTRPIAILTPREHFLTKLLAYFIAPSHHI